MNLLRLGFILEAVAGDLIESSHLLQPWSSRTWLPTGNLSPWRWDRKPSSALGSCSPPHPRVPALPDGAAGAHRLLVGLRAVGDGRRRQELAHLLRIYLGLLGVVFKALRTPVRGHTPSVRATDLRDPNPGEFGCALSLCSAPGQRWASAVITVCLMA